MIYRRTLRAAANPARSSKTRLLRECAVFHAVSPPALGNEYLQLWTGN
jgi:hypothetical protein